MSTIFLTSSRNILKRDPSSGTTELSPPRTAAYSGLYVTNYTVPHDLGYVPVFRYYYEPFGDGSIWPPLTDRATGEAFNPVTSAVGPGIIGWADENNLYLQLFHDTNTLTADYPVYWVIYKDFAL